MTSELPKLSVEVAAAIEAAQLQPKDAGAVALIRRYAAAIDTAPAGEAAAITGDLGPKLLNALSALGLTVAGRSTRAGGGTDGELPTAALDKLRSERGASARANRSQALHVVTG